MSVPMEATLRSSQDVDAGLRDRLDHEDAGHGRVSQASTAAFVPSEAGRSPALGPDGP